MPPKKPANGKTRAQMKDIGTPIVLAPDELAALRYRWEMWQAQRFRAHDEKVIADILKDIAPTDSSDARWQITHRQQVRAHNEEMLEALLQDCHTEYVRGLRGRYSLPPKYVVDWETGLVSPAEATDD